MGWTCRSFRALPEPYKRQIGRRRYTKCILFYKIKDRSTTMILASGDMSNALMVIEMQGDAG